MGISKAARIVGGHGSSYAYSAAWRLSWRADEDGVTSRRTREAVAALVDTVVAENVGGRRAEERAEPTEEAPAVRCDYAAPAPAGACGADEVERRRQPQEHLREKGVGDDVICDRRRAGPPAAAAPHGGPERG